LKKYLKTPGDYISFSGDNRDALSWFYWCVMWISQCYRITRFGGYFMMFCDWRQYSLADIALQAGGFIRRGTIVWNKTRAARAPHTGYARHQCEYILWGTKGDCFKATDRGPLDGCFTFPVKQKDKHHPTGKPTPLLQELVRVVPQGSTILDCFMGSGTTGVAAIANHQQFIGVEMDKPHYDIAHQRLRNINPQAN
jgi:site-specific DNA-methyltransferase (adenine-specific)